MTNAEAAALLLRASGVDGRKAGELQARMWGHLLRDLDATDAMEAVDRHYMISEKWLMPVHVINGVEQIQRERLGRARQAELEAERASENDGDADLEPATSGEPKAPLALTAGPLHQRLDEVHAGRREARDRFADRREAEAEKERIRKERKAKRAEILAELEARREQANA